MRLRDTARHRAASEIGKRHPYLTLLLGPLLPAILGVIGLGLLVWAVIKATHRVHTMSLPGLPHLPMPNISLGAGILVVAVAVVLFVVRKVWKWSNGY